MKSTQFSISLTTVILIISICFFSGCGLPKRIFLFSDPNAIDKNSECPDYALKSLLFIKNINKTLKTFKCIGKVKIWYKNSLVMDARAAWIGSKPSKLSLTVLSSGYPIFKLANNGQWLYTLESYDKKPCFKKKKTTDGSLKKIIAIPIKCKEIVAILSGRAPLYEDKPPKLYKTNSDEYKILSLNKWWGVREKIFMKQTDLIKIEMYKITGSLAYRIRFDQIKNVNGYRIPYKITIENKKIVFQIQIDKYWADAPLKESMFILQNHSL